MKMGTREGLRNKKFMVLILLLSSVIQIYSQDLIIFRDGTEKKVRVAMVTNDNTTFTDASDKSATSQTVDNTSIYMIKYGKRGNVFFTAEGKRLTGDGDGKVPSNATVIYLLEGNEVIAYNVSIEEGQITFYSSKKKGTPQISVLSDKVFLIKYPDGTKDMINSFEEQKQKEAEALAEKLRSEEEARQAELRNRYPKNAVIKTLKNLDVRVSILSENNGVITYKKTNLKNSPVFNMDRSNIKEVIYINK